jgi:hypothetical protein
MKQRKIEMAASRLIPSVFGIKVVENFATLLLAHLPTIKRLEHRSLRASDVVILTKEAPLTRISERIHFVTPMPAVMEPRCRRVRI